MKYYLITPRVDGQTSEEFLERMFSEHIVMMGWDETTVKGKAFANMNKGDIVLVAQRVYGKFNYYFAGIVSDSSSNTDGDYQYRKLEHFIDLRKTDINILEGVSFKKMSTIPALQEIHLDKNKSVIDKLNQIIQL